MNERDLNSKQLETMIYIDIIGKEIIHIYIYMHIIRDEFFFSFSF